MQPKYFRTFSYCYEQWDSDMSRLVYTLVCFLTQYLIPCFIVGAGYYRYSTSYSTMLHSRGGAGYYR